MTDAWIKTRNQPQYMIISDELRRRIIVGEYPVGGNLPTESELCVEFSISRHTAREALRRLADAGFISRRQGSGSKVLQSDPPKQYVHTMRSLDQLFAYAANTRLRMISIEQGCPDPATGVSDDRPWLVCEALRMEQDKDEPISYSLVYIDGRFAGLRDALKNYQGAIYKLIESTYNVVVEEVVQVIEVVQLPERAVELLGLEPGTWGARVVRRYLDARGAVLIASVNYHPFDKFLYEMRLSRQGKKLT